MRPIIREQSGDQWVGNRFEGAVRDGEDESPQIEQHVGRVLGHSGRRAEGDEGGQKMEAKGGNDQFAITDLVAEQATDDDAEAKSSEAGSIDVSQLSGGEPKVGSPIGEDAPSNAEPDSRGQNGSEASPEEPFCVWCNSVGASVTHSFVFWFWSITKFICWPVLLRLGFQ